MNSISRLICTGLALALIAGATAAPVSAGLPASVAPAAQTTVSPSATAAGKDEVVYARLSGNGGALGIYVVNHFTSAGAGSITDYGDYTAVVNLTDLQPIPLESGKVTVAEPGESFYYQGYLTGVDLPWQYNIEYRLNGVLTPPESLGGKSGSLEIKMTAARNVAVNSVFYNNYMQQITVTLNNESCVNIKANGATTANAGKNRILVYTILPGQDADITITADVADFEMAGIEITAMPFSMSFDIPDMDDMLDDFNLLTGAISELSDGVGKLNDGAAEMASGSVELKDGSAEFLDGLAQLSANSGQLTGASAQIMDALSMIASALDGADISPDMLSELTRLPVMLTQLADGLKQVEEGMQAQKDAYSLAYAALDKAIIAIPGAQIDEARLRELYEKADADEQALLDQLIESHALAKATKDTYELTRQVFSSVTTAFDSISRSNIPAMLNLMSGQIGGALSDMDIIDQLGLLVDGLSELSANYSTFHGGLRSFMQGVTALATGYVELDGGVSGLSDGILEMSGGISELHDGTNRLAAETSSLPELMKNEIENLISEFSSAEFEAVSFTSDMNTGVSFVQFVFKAEGITKPPAEANRPDEAGDLSFWNRLTRLFGR